MSGRNRSEGWRHAKRSGHSNEAIIRQKLLEDKGYASTLSRRMGVLSSIQSVEVGGLNETSVPSIFGSATKSKSDLRIVFSDGTTKNISLKKSEGGQVYLIGQDRFIEGYEKHFSSSIDFYITKGIYLFFGNDVTPRFPPAGIRAGRLFCASARLKQWAA